MTRGIDDKQIDDGNLGPPDVAHFNWTRTQVVAGTEIPLQYSGTKITGDQDLYWIQDIYRDAENVPYRVVDSLYNINDNSLRWRKDDYLLSSGGVVIGTSGTITGEDSDR